MPNITSESIDWTKTPWPRGRRPATDKWYKPIFDEAGKIVEAKWVAPGTIGAVEVPPGLGPKPAFAWHTDTRDSTKLAAQLSRLIAEKDQTKARLDQLKKDVRATKKALLKALKRDM